MKHSTNSDDNKFPVRNYHFPFQVKKLLRTTHKYVDSFLLILHVNNYYLLRPRQLCHVSRKEVAMNAPKIIKFNNFIMLNEYFITSILIICAPGIFSMDGNGGEMSSFNYLVSIWDYCDHLCSGVIIDERHILTVGHCVRDISVSRLFVFAGMVDLENPTMEGAKEVHSVWLHPHSEEVFKPLKSNNVYWTHDIAVIKLKHELIWSPTIALVNVICGDADWNVLREFVIPGWNSAVIEGPQRMFRVSSQGTIMPEKECLQKNTMLLPNEKCITVPVIRYHNDGSPVIYDSALIGLIVGGGTTFEEPLTGLAITPHFGFILSVIRDDRTAVDPDEFRYVVSIWYNNTIKCGGIIIDSSHILTVGHCVRALEVDTFRVVAGRSDVSNYLHETIEFLEVDRITCHPGYKELWSPQYQSRPWILHDIAILKLKQPLVWSSTVARAALLNEIDPVPELYYEAARWEQSIIADVTQSINLKWSFAISEPQASRHVDSLENEIVLVGANSLSISNPGSYGNPIVCDGVVIGIIVHSFPDNSILHFVPTVVLTINNYLPFIESTISKI